MACMGRHSQHYYRKYVSFIITPFYRYATAELTSTLVLTLTISVGVEDRPAAAPQTGPWKSDFKLFQSPSTADAFAALSSIVFAYAGTPAFFNIVAEMRDPRHYTRSLAICQGTMTAVYITIGCVVYYYCGSYVASPALGSAGKTMKKVSYGLALPGLIVTTMLYVHVRRFVCVINARLTYVFSFRQSTSSYVFSEALIILPKIPLPTG